MPFPHRAVLRVGDHGTNANSISRHVARSLTAGKSTVVAAPAASLKTSLPNTLRGCHDLIRDLQRENIRLREAGAFFGQLAERLNLELRQHRDRLSGEEPDARYLPSPSQLPRQGSEPNDH
jgi:hypothetical protein